MVEYDYRASSLKKVDLDENVELSQSGHKPQSGDVVAVKVTDVNHSYRDLDLEGGTLVELEEGDVVLGVLGNRSGVKGYIGEVPEVLDEDDSLDFLGSGGIFGRYVSGAKELDQPCSARFLGYVSDGESILNTLDFGVEHAEEIDSSIEVVAVVASRMDAGKTTLASKLIENLSEEYRVGSAKFTGSARERDRLEMLDAGSEVSLDFVDAGLPSTVEDRKMVVSAAKGLISRIDEEHDVDVVVAEFGAGLISNYRVKDVLSDLDIRELVSTVSAAALDVAGADGLKSNLEDMDYELDLVSGPITDTTVGRESIQNEIGVPALNAFYGDQMDEVFEIVSENLEADESG